MPLKLTATKELDWSGAKPPAGITLGKVHFGPDPHGLGGFQVATAMASAIPSRQALRHLFNARKGKTQIQLVVAIEHGATTTIFGPDAQAIPVELATDQAERQLQSVLTEPDVLAATERFAGLRKANDSTGLTGFANNGLFASHHIKHNVPNRSDWAALASRAQPLLGLRATELIKGLGFAIQPGPNSSLLLTSGGEPPRVVAVLLDETEQFDTAQPKFGNASAVSLGLAVAQEQQLPWLVVVRKDQIRLYPGKDGVGVGSKGQAETFFEIDLSNIDSEYAALLPLIFSANALGDEGTTDELLKDSGRYATELGARLRERVYDEIIPPMAVEVANALHENAGLTLGPEDLATAYRVTLRILFRLLFQAYAEDRRLLPADRNEYYAANSIKENGKRLLALDEPAFGESASLWNDLEQVWNVIDKGNEQWQVPSYNGGLFNTDPERSPEGALIDEIELADSVLGPALQSLLIDHNEDGVEGLVDFSSLSVREFGTIYEGLLESSLSLAEQDLTVDNSGAWVPAKDDETALAPAGTVYFHTASGERKATGSYFTPKVVVDHLIERSIVPTLTAHLDKIAEYLAEGDSSAAAREFFDFRVADLAMGSGHFLVAAIDKIESLMRTFLTQHNVPGVTDEILRLAAVARDALGADDVAKSEVDEVGLLRRQIARRCIYGLDINPMAVELARLALWIHTFVPGLPMSNLDHGLVNANSLTGIGTVDEALDELIPSRNPGEPTFFDGIIIDNLDTAKTLLIDLANASEANKAEVEESARTLAKAREAADLSRRTFGAAVAARLGKIQTELIVSQEQLEAMVDQPVVQETVEPLKPAHMPFLFPEVFLRDDPGFDVLLGNPPWEKLKIETDGWWGLRLPGLRSMPQREKNPALAAFRESRPDLEGEFEAEQAAVLALNAVIKSGPFNLGSGDTDLYQAFAWRNWQLLRGKGRFGVVLPRGALSGSGLSAWRKEILDRGEFANVVFLLNSQQWVFDQVHPQYTVGLTVVSRGDGGVVRWAGPFSSEEDFHIGRDDLADVPADEFASWSPTAGFPLVPNKKSADVFLKMKESPRFDEVPCPRSRVTRELDASGDKELMEFDVGEPKGRIPVLAGASYHLWEPDFGDPYAYSEADVLRPHLASKLANQVRGARSAYSGMEWPAGVLPMDQPRIAFRDITRATDTRTTIACLLPPGTSAVHSSPVLVRREGDTASEAFLLGVMCSIPFDWGSRRWVELHLTFEVLNSLPVPLYREENAIAQRVVEAAGRLAAVDDRYADWANQVGVPFGSVKAEAEKNDLIYELDALVSLLYGLTEDQVEHIFKTFHRGWDYQPRLDAVLDHFRTWKDKA